MNKATELILNKLTAEDATDPQRLLSSEFLSVLLINAKSKQQWSVAMGQLLFLSHRLLDKLLGEWEIDTTDSKDKTVLSSCAEVATGSFLALEGCNFGRANFAPYLKVCHVPQPQRAMLSAISYRLWYNLGLLLIFVQICLKNC